MGEGETRHPGVCVQCMYICERMNICMYLCGITSVAKWLTHLALIPRASVRIPAIGGESIPNCSSSHLNLSINGYLEKSEEGESWEIGYYIDSLSRCDGLPPDRLKGVREATKPQDFINVRICYGSMYVCVCVQIGEHISDFVDIRFDRCRYDGGDGDAGGGVVVEVTVVMRGGDKNGGDGGNAWR